MSSGNDSRTLRLLADYECHPLWITSSEATVNVSPDDPALGLSAGLAARLDAWAATYDGTLSREDPAASGFPTAAAEHEFAATGEALARQLAEELGRSWRVTSFDQRIRADREVPDPDSRHRGGSGVHF